MPKYSPERVPVETLHKVVSLRLSNKYRHPLILMGDDAARVVKSNLFLKNRYSF